MQRVQASSDASVDLFGSGKHGYTDGSPGVIAATEVHSDQFLNPVQEEIATACERSGIALSTTDNNQLFKAIFLRQARSTLVNSAARASSTGAAMYALGGRVTLVGQSPLMILVGATGAIGTSIDGTTWTARTAGAAYAGTWHGAWIDSGSAVIVGSSGEIQTSADMATWTHRATGGAFAGTGVTARHTLLRFDDPPAWCSAGGGSSGGSSRRGDVADVGTGRDFGQPL
jgi:hypothetical protein